MGGKEGSFIKAVFSKQRNASIAPRERLGIVDSPLGVTCLGLGANILESDDGAVMTWLGREVKAKSLTVLFLKGNHIEVCLYKEWARWRYRRRVPGPPSPVGRVVRPPPNHDPHLPGLFDPGLPQRKQPRNH